MKKELPHRFDLFQAVQNAGIGFLLATATDTQAQKPFCGPNDHCIEITGATITGYVPNAPNGVATGQCEEPCDITLSGKEVQFGKTAACSSHVSFPNAGYRVPIPFGTQILIKESTGKANGNIYTCEDGGELDDNEVDVAADFYTDNPYDYTDINKATIIYKLPAAQ